MVELTRQQISAVTPPLPAAFDVFVKTYEDVPLPIATFTITPNTTIGELQKRTLACTKFKSEERIQIWIYYQGSTKKAKDPDATVESLRLRPGSTILVEDKGVQISTRLTKVNAHMGPPIMFTLFRLFPQHIYSFLLNEYPQSPQDICMAQRIVYALVMIHFAKCVFEDLFVSYYKREYMSNSASALKVMTHWVAFGFTFAFFVFHPYYTQPQWYEMHGNQGANPSEHTNYLPVYGLCTVFCFAELLSLLSNIHLASVNQFKDMHPEIEAKGSTMLIPNQHGFNTVSCANYFWLLCCWTIIAIASETLYAYLILLVIFINLNQKAQKIHYSYVAKHREMYPEARRALIPYLF